MADNEIYWRQRLATLDEKYSSDQPRVPDGNPDGGQWTYVAGYAQGHSSTQRDFDSFLRGKPRNETVLAQYRPRSAGSIEEEFPEATFGQQARLAAAEANARAAISRLQQLDPNFQLSPSLTATRSIEGAIAAAEAHAREAEVRLAEINANRNLNEPQGEWTFGSHKSEQKWINRMQERSWTREQIDDAIKYGRQSPAENKIRPKNGATAYINPMTGRRVVIDNITREVLHIGGDDFGY